MGSADLYIGLISGTSADGIDAALVSFTDGTPTLLSHHLHPIPTALRTQLIDLFTPGDEQVDALGELDHSLGTLFSDAIDALLAQSGCERHAVCAIGSHGQTVRHRPDGKHPFTLQIADPNRIAHLQGIDVVADFRRRDMACGGQGAPLAPLFHQAFLGCEHENRVILNLGGIANITLLPAGRQQPPLAMDTGPASGLMDAWCQRVQGQPFDHGGQWAASGQRLEAPLTAWLADPYFARSAPKSTGKEYFHLEWLASRTSGLDELAPADVQATLLELTASSIVEAMAKLPLPADRVLVCGGGVHNEALMARLTALSPCPVDSTSDYGLDPDWVEAMCFAWLAKCYMEGERLDTGPFTGATAPVLLGGLYKG